MVGDAEDKIILDLGAGPNPISKKIKAKKKFIHDVDNKFTPHGNIFADLNTEPIPLPASSVDIIIAGEFIEHMYNPIKFLKECRRVLKKGGKIILSTPNIASLKNRFKLLFGEMPEHCATANMEGVDSFQTHVKDFNLKLLKNLLDGNGFKISQTSTNGIIFRSRLMLPLFLTPNTFGEILIISAIKK